MLGIFSGQGIHLLQMMPRAMLIIASVDDYTLLLALDLSYTLLRYSLESRPGSGQF